jgi:trigger factor
MKTTIQKLPKSKIEILFEIPWKEEFEEYFKKAALILGKDITVKGFRPGKVPQEIVEKEIGAEKILQKAANLAVEEKYSQVLREKKIEAASQPKINITKLAQGNPFEFKAEISVLPKINLPDYKKIASRIKKREVLVEDKDVEDAVNWLQQSRAVFSPLEREAEFGDFIEIEYQSPQIENNKIFKDKFVLGKAKFVPGFEENLKEMRKGEEKEFSILFPEDYSNKLLAGKKILFRVKMKSVQKMELPEINDEFARQLGKFENLNSLKENLRQGIKKEKELEESQRIRNEILEQIAQNSECELPESLVEIEKNHLLDDLKQRVSQGLQISFEEYLIQIKKTEEEIKNSFLENAQKRVKNFLVLREIGKAENIVVSEKEIKEETNKILKKYSDLANTKEKIDLDRLKDYTESVIYNEKVFKKLENFSS